jgi:hypothetical protein
VALPVFPYACCGSKKKARPVRHPERHQQAYPVNQFLTDET